MPSDDVNRKVVRFSRDLLGHVIQKQRDFELGRESS